MGKKYLILGILVMALTLSAWGDQKEGQGHEPGICVPSAGQESRFTIWNIDEDGREGLLVIVVGRQTDPPDIQYTFYSRTR